LKASQLVHQERPPGGAYTLRRQVSLEPFTLLTQPVDFGVHPIEKGFSRSRRYPRFLELKDFLPLPADLNPHVFDFPPDVVDVHFTPEVE
jgi:hypothetical protein